jgi:hypothetical protein
MIKKSGSKYVLYSKDGSRKLGEGTKKEMEKREKEVEMFKHMKKKK